MMSLIRFVGTVLFGNDGDSCETVAAATTATPVVQTEATSFIDSGSDSGSEQEEEEEDDSKGEGDPESNVLSVDAKRPRSPQTDMKPDDHPSGRPVKVQLLDEDDVPFSMDGVNMSILDAQTLEILAVQPPAPPPPPPSPLLEPRRADGSMRLPLSSPAGVPRIEILDEDDPIKGMAACNVRKWPPFLLPMSDHHRPPCPSHRLVRDVGRRGQWRPRRLLLWQRGLRR
jgi:hypothetical protein